MRWVSFEQLADLFDGEQPVDEHRDSNRELVDYEIHDPWERRPELGSAR